MTPFLLFLTLLVPQTAPPPLPDTPAGRRVAAYFDAFNAGEDAMAAFVRDNFTAAALAQRPIADRIAVYRQMKSGLGHLKFTQLVSATATTAERTIVVRAATDSGESPRVQFRLEPDEAAKLIAIGIEVGNGPDEGPGPGPGTRPPAVVDVRARSVAINRALDRATAAGFTGAVLVAQKGEPLVYRALGLANRARRAPIDRQTVFDIGSNVKDFTKVAIFQLVEAGTLTLDTTLGKIFPAAPADKAALTVQQLLDHKSGLSPNLVTDPTKLSRADFLTKAFASPLQSTPGTTFLYSNAGYSMLAAIIEEVSKQPYEAYLASHVFPAAGLTATGYVSRQWGPNAIAHSYMGDQDRGSTFDFPHWDDGTSWSLRGNGGMLSTLDDMLKFYLAIKRGALVTAEHAAKVVGSDAVLVGGNGVHFFLYRADAANQLDVLIASTDAAFKAMTLDADLRQAMEGGAGR